jgi:hypothetical protein
MLLKGVTGTSGLLAPAETKQNKNKNCKPVTPVVNAVYINSMRTHMVV